MSVSFIFGSRKGASPETIAAAKAEFAKSRGPNFVYKPLVGVRKPPLDYRKNGSLADAG